MRHEMDAARCSYHAPRPSSLVLVNPSAKGDSVRHQFGSFQELDIIFDGFFQIGECQEVEFAILEFAQRFGTT